MSQRKKLFASQSRWDFQFSCSEKKPKRFLKTLNPLSHPRRSYKLTFSRLAHVSLTVKMRLTQLIRLIGCQGDVGPDVVQVCSRQQASLESLLSGRSSQFRPSQIQFGGDF